MTSDCSVFYLKCLCRKARICAAQHYIQSNLSLLAVRAGDVVSLRGKSICTDTATVKIKEVEINSA